MSHLFRSLPISSDCVRSLHRVSSFTLTGSYILYSRWWWYSNSLVVEETHFVLLSPFTVITIYTCIGKKNIVKVGQWLRYSIEFLTHLEGSKQELEWRNLSFSVTNGGLAFRFTGQVKLSTTRLTWLRRRLSNGHDKCSYSFTKVYRFLPKPHDVDSIAEPIAI